MVLRLRSGMSGARNEVMNDPLDRPDTLLFDVTNMGHYIEVHMKNSPNTPMRIVLDNGIAIQGIPHKIERSYDTTLLYIKIPDGTIVPFNIEDITDMTVKVF